MHRQEQLTNTAARPFPREEYEGRWQRVYAAMRERGHHALIVWQRGAGGLDRAINVHWLANFVSVGSGQDWADETASLGWSFSALLFHDGREPELHTGQPERQTDTTALACGRAFFHTGDVLQALARHLKSLGIEGRVAVVGDDTLPGLYDRVLRRLTPQIEWVTEEYLLFEAQRIKSPRELEVYRRAGEIVSEALTEAMQAMIAGTTTAEAASRAVATVVRNGGGVHRADMTFGPRSERLITGDPLHGYSLARPAPGDIVRGWVYGPILAGYWLDPGRSAVSQRRPDRAQQALLEGSAGIVEAIIAAVRPGVTIRSLAAAGDVVARRVGYHDHPQLLPVFGHQIGPYLGPEIFPDGFLATDGMIGDASAAQLDTPLQAGMVIGVEAFLTHEGVGTAAFEQNLIVTKQGSELLTTTPLVF